MEKTTKSFASACKDFFGMQPGQGLKQFQEELKALTLKDRMEIAEGLHQNGYTNLDPISDPTAPAVEKVKVQWKV